jgi:hypothetical protein
MRRSFVLSFVGTDGLLKHEAELEDSGPFDPLDINIECGFDSRQFVRLLKHPISGQVQLTVDGADFWLNGGNIGFAYSEWLFVPGMVPALVDDLILRGENIVLPTSGNLTFTFGIRGAEVLSQTGIYFAEVRSFSDRSLVQFKPDSALIAIDEQSGMFGLSASLKAGRFELGNVLPYETNDLAEIGEIARAWFEFVELYVGGIFQFEARTRELAHGLVTWNGNRFVKTV